MNARNLKGSSRSDFENFNDTFFTLGQAFEVFVPLCKFTPGSAYNMSRKNRLIDY